MSASHDVAIAELAGEASKPGPKPKRGRRPGTRSSKPSPGPGEILASVAADAELAIRQRARLEEAESVLEVLPGHAVADALGGIDEARNEALETLRDCRERAARALAEYEGLHRITADGEVITVEVEDGAVLELRVMSVRRSRT